jgi:preprotein translocase subunit SecD
MKGDFMSNRRRRRDAEDGFGTEQTDDAVAIEQVESETQEPVAVEKSAPIVETTIEETVEETAQAVEETVASVETVIEVAAAAEPSVEIETPVAVDVAMPSIADLEEEARKLEERRRWLKRRRR